MVCVPCFIVPVLLYLWHKFVQPILLKYWNPWATKDKDGNVTPSNTTKSPFDCTGGVCRFARKNAVPNSLPGKESSVISPNSAEDALDAKSL